MALLPDLTYTAGWKYSTTGVVRFDLPYDQFGSLPHVGNEEFDLVGGKAPCLTIFPDFLWDGPSSLTYDSPDSMTPSLFHDCGYYACRLGLLDYTIWRSAIDAHFLTLLRAAGMAELRALTWYSAVRLAAEPQAVPQEERQVFVQGV